MRGHARRGTLVEHGYAQPCLAGQDAYDLIAVEPLGNSAPGRNTEVFG